MSTTSQTHVLLKSLRSNQISSSATTWLISVLTALDAKDVEAYTSFMAPSVRVSFNNGEMALNGLPAVRDGLFKFWQSFGALRHEVLNIYGTDCNLVHEALNHYETLDGREVLVRAVAWIDRNEGGEIEEVRVYHDQSPLWGGGAHKEGFLKQCTVVVKIKMFR